MFLVDCNRQGIINTLIIDKMNFLWAFTFPAVFRISVKLYYPNYPLDELRDSVPTDVYCCRSLLSSAVQSRSWIIITGRIFMFDGRVGPRKAFRMNWVGFNGA
jgi:hypothetical protein